MTRARTTHVLGLCSLLFGGSAAAEEPVRPPNIVLFLADDIGFSDTAPYGGEVPTPTISELAAAGVTFTNHHTAASCAPTRGMLLTGVDSHLNGVPNIPESIPPVQAKHANYRGTLNHNVVTIATLLRDAGYHTYMTGKWHLGKSPDLLPSQRGFERTIAMADTGADNWEQKPYLPMYDKANWFGDGKEIELPEDFYSSKFFIDKTIEFIESNRRDGRPFFSYVPFQAVHMPVQAPQSFTEKYVGEYDAGWHVLREQRLERAKALGVVPEATLLAPVTGTPDWDALSDEDKAYDSKKMAVYAGMIDAMDHHMGRLIAYIREIGEYDNTVFIFMSDNGPEASDITSGWRGMYLRGWFRTHGYDTDYDTLGTRGSFVALGTGFGVSAASPLAYYKWFAHEGGMRVPLIIAGEPVGERGRLSGAFTFVTDLAPTILQIAGVEPPRGTYGDRKVEAMRGKSLLPLLSNEAPRVHPPDEPIGYELGGNTALFKGDFKIVADRGPIGDGEWHLFNYVADPGEAHDLKEQMPERFAEMLEDYRIYARDNQVLPVPDGYDQRTEVIFYTIRNNPSPLVLATAALLALLVLFLLWRGVRRLARRRGPFSAALLLGVLILAGQTRAEPVKVPTTSELDGEYAYAGNRAKEEAAIQAKVDAATVGMSRMVLKRATPRLQSSTRIPPTVKITHQGSSVTFKMNDHVVTVPEHGGSVPVTTPLGETADASFEVKKATLLQSVAKTGGEKRNTFRFNEAGQLVMNVRITNSRLAAPVTFSLLYARVHP